jgi:hypothetical protein
MKIKSKTKQQQKKNMIALINTTNQIDNISIGTVISRHRTFFAAAAASAKFQADVRRANGANSYIPTRIVTLTRRHAVGNHVNQMYSKAWR